MANALGQRLAAPMFLLALSVGPLGAQPDSCGHLGQSFPLSSPVLMVGLSDLLSSDSATREARTRSVISTSGVLGHRYGPSRLCLSFDHARYRLMTDCLVLAFDWDELDVDRDDAERLLAQWSGRWVMVSGFLSPESDRSQLGERGEIGVLTLSLRRSPTGRLYPSDCLGYDGPMRPSGEEEFDRARGLGGSRCRRSLIPFNGGDAWACLERYEPIIWLRKGPIPSVDDVGSVQKDHRIAFDPPPPYAARDIWEFTPIVEGIYLFTLADGRLFALANDDVRELDSDRVDQLRRTHELDLVYYRVRPRNTEEAGPRTALRVIGADLTPETLWESKDWTLTHIKKPVGGEPLVIFVTRDSERRALSLDTKGTWVELPLE